MTDLITSAAAKELANSKLAEKVYDDAGSPLAKQVGAFGADLAKTARLLLAPLQIAAHLQDRLEGLLERLKNRVPEDRRVELRAEIVGPSLETMRYLENHSPIWKMFEEILIKSSDKESSSLVHPAFINIIKQLTKDEAKIILRLMDGPMKIVWLQELTEDRKFGERKYEEWPIDTLGLDRPEDFRVYYDNLESMSLTQWPITKQSPILEGSKQTGSRSFSEIILTNLGKRFADACIPPGGFE